jgi:hypothetical protein
MRTITLRLPSFLHRGVKQLAQREDVSMNRAIGTGVTAKLSAFMTEDYLAERAARGRRERFEAVLRKVPHVEPEGVDRLD